MIRWILLAAAAGFLSACAADIPQTPVILGRSADEAVAPDDAHCQAVARERADDALANGYGLQIEQGILQETYQDCMAWRTGKPG
jgi:hypothetical protein